MKKLKVLWLMPHNKHDTDSYTESGAFKLPSYGLAPFRLDAYCGDLIDSKFLKVDDNYNDIILKEIDIVAISMCGSIYSSVENSILERILSIIDYIRKNSKAKIFLGGSLIISNPKLESLVDWCCYFEGEKPLREALLNIINNKPLINSKNHNPLEQKELNNLPPIKIEFFENNHIPIQFATGCRGNCVFCLSRESQGRKLRRPSLEKIISDLTHYVNNGIKEFHIIDDDLFIDHNYYMEIFKFFIKNNIKINFPQIPFYLEEDELDILLKSNTLFYRITPDACNERIFNLIGKRGNFKNLKNYIEYIRNNKPESLITIQFLINYPWETEEDLKEGIEFYSNLPVNLVQVVPIEILENSPLYNFLQEKNKNDLQNYLLNGVETAKKMMIEINGKLKPSIATSKEIKEMEESVTNYINNVYGIKIK